MSRASTEKRLDKSDKTKILVIRLTEIYEYLPWIWLHCVSFLDRRKNLHYYSAEEYLKITYIISVLIFISQLS
jgi:uncharacterized metal-binding protein